ncbi:class I SAM-dependent DNA methyltransferase [Rahnella sp. PAMC25617]|uniref:class I SAM-dependent DNA methyltransferase n=1 Tax=Rahnella TaxID=34037 RepID=UPI0013306D36|nr:class I SAM-dependent methyltransferase [Rahnella variigena]
MTQNIYDDQAFFDGYAQLGRSQFGLDGAPEWPSLKALLPDMKNARVVDLGCGYGWFCRAAREMGADDVLGLDVSEKMLDKARSMTPDTVIRYERRDLETLTLPEASFNLAYSSLTLHYIDALPAMFRTVYQALEAGGHFVFSAEHPVYTAPSEPGWKLNGQGHKTWPVEGYQREGQRVTDWFAEGVIKQHRKLGTYINLLIEAGFVICHLDEWGPSAKQIAAYPDLAEEAERPMLFLMSVRKPR